MKSGDNLFSVNQRLEIAPGESMEYFSSRVEDFNDEDMWIAMPMHNTIPVYLPKGEKLVGRFIAEEGLVTSFESTLLDYRLTPLPVWLIKKPENVVQLQQRSFFRYGLTLPVKYFLLDENGMPVEGSEAETVSKNLSGGGIMIIAPKNRAIPIGTMLWIEITLGEMDVIRGRAQVLRQKTRKLQGEGKIFLLGLKFLGMDEITRKKIINFLNLKILERRRRGML